MHLVYISKPRFESFDKPHVAVLQSAGFKNAFRALLSGYARIKRPKHSPEKMYALYTAMLMAVGMLLPCFFPTLLVISGWVGSFLVPLQTHSVIVSIVFGQLWVSEVVRSTVNRHHGVACRIVHLYIPSCHLKTSENYMSTFIKIYPWAIASSSPVDTLNSSSLKH